MYTLYTYQYINIYEIRTLGMCIYNKLIHLSVCVSVYLSPICLCICVCIYINIYIYIYILYIYIYIHNTSIYIIYTYI